MVSREFVDHLMLGSQQDFADLRIVKREQGGADLFGFDFVQLGVGDLVGSNAEFAGGQLAVLVGRVGVERELTNGNASALPRYSSRHGFAQPIRKRTDCGRCSVVPVVPESREEVVHNGSKKLTR